MKKAMSAMVIDLLGQIKHLLGTIVLAEFGVRVNPMAIGRLEVGVLFGHRFQDRDRANVSLEAEQRHP